jgi:hypothetical protein
MSRFRPAPPTEPWATLVVLLPHCQIQRVCVIFEGYDNLAVVRTPLGEEGRIFVYVWERDVILAQKLLQELSREFPVSVTGPHPGMLDIETLWD